MENEIKYIGPYKVIQELGRGGMGAVYLGYDENLQRYIAIKVILGETNNIAFKRFIREAQTISNLNHRHIVKLYHLEVGKDKPYMVMEYIDGHLLIKHIKKNKLTMKESLQLLVDIIDAVAFAHTNGIIHRDIKSNNIIVDNDGKALLMDFGLAKLVELEDKSLTKTGNFIGTPKYMSPEQAKGRKVLTPLIDIYSLGVVMYEVLTGDYPTKGDSTMEVLFNLLNASIIPPSKINKRIPPDLDKICLKALARNPKYRYQSAKELSNDLRDFLGGKKVKVKLEKSIKRLKLTAAVVILALLISIFSQSQVKIEESAFTRAMGWVNKGFWEKAKQELEKIDIPEDEITRRNLEKQKRYYQVLINGYSESDHEEFYKHHDLLPDHQKELPEIQAAELFLLAKYNYNQQRFSEALKFFLVLEKIERNHNILPSYIKADLFYHMGICSENDNDKIRYFEESLGSSSSNEFVYYQLAKIYFKYREDSTKLHKAERYIEECVELDDSRVDYHLLLGNIALQKGNLEKARKSFEIVRLIDDSNIEALKGMTEIALHDVALFERFFFSFLGSLEGWQYKYKDVISIFIEDVEKENKRYYREIIKIAKKQKNDISWIALESWNDSDTIKASLSKEAILAARHHPDFFTVGSKLNIAQEDFYKDIVEQRKIEKERANYYLMAKLFLYPKSSIIDEIEQTEIEKILHDPEEKPIYRYLAANTLILLLDFEKVRKIAKNTTTNSLLRLLCAASLEDHYIFSQYSDLIPPLTNNDLFVKVLLTKNHRLISWNSKNIQEIFTEQELHVRLAKIIYGIEKNIGTGILKDFESNPILNEIANNYYYAQVATEQEIKSISVDIFVSLKESSQITLLERALKNKDLFSENFVKEILKENNISPYTKIRAIDFLANKGSIQINDIKILENDIVHAYGFYKAFLVHLMTKFFPPQDNYLTTIENRNFLRCYGYGVYSKCGQEVLSLLKEEDDTNIQSIVIRTSTIKPFGGPMSLLQRRYDNNTRREVVKKYLDSEHFLLRKEAYKAYFSFFSAKDLSGKTLLSITNEAITTSDQAQKEGSIEAIVCILEDLLRIFSPVNDDSLLLLIEIEDLHRINNIKTIIKHSEWEKTYHQVSQQILTVQSHPTAYFIQAMIARQNNNYKEAIEKMTKVIEEKSDSIFYLLELVLLYTENKEEIPEKILKNILHLIRTKKINPTSLTILTSLPKENIWIEKILKQSCLMMSSEKDKLSYPLNFRNSLWAIAWKNSWENLQSYLGSSEQNIAVEVLQNNRDSSK